MTPVKDRRKGGVGSVDPRKGGIGPRVPTYEISGFTRDYDTRLTIPNCDVHLFRTSDDSEVAQTVSNGNGYYQFAGLPDTTTEYYMVAYKTGTPDIAGTTLNTIQAA